MYGNAIVWSGRGKSRPGDNLVHTSESPDHHIYGYLPCRYRVNIDNIIQSEFMVGVCGFIYPLAENRPRISPYAMVSSRVNTAAGQQGLYETESAK